MKRKKLIRSVISLSLVIVMLCSLSIPVFAAQKPEETVSPNWTSISNMKIDMAFVGTQGCVNGTARKQSTASNIMGTLTLFKWNGTEYEYMDEISGSKSIGTLSVCIEFEAEVGVQYKAIWVVGAFTNGISEWHTIQYLETCR